MRDTKLPLSEERVAAYLRGELSASEHAQVEAAIDEDPQWLTVIALLAREQPPADATAKPDDDRSDPPSNPPKPSAKPPTTGSDDGDDPTVARIEREQAARLRPGARLGRYEVEGPLGRGGMGMVYAAYDPELERRVALKLLRGGDSTGQARLLREARALARLSDRHVITIHDVGTWQGRVFLAMELLEGQTLAAWRTESPARWSEVLSVFIDAGRGLQAAHAAGLVHRDFKPSNVMLTEDGRVVVLDFGLAHAVERGLSLSESLPGDAGANKDDTDGSLTQTGQLLGTPAYMAPEQRRGEPCGPATDQFSFCVALYEALHGHLPEAATKIPGRLDRAPATGRLPRRIERLLATGLDREPPRRHASMAELVDALEAVVRPRRRRLALAGLAALGGAAGAWALLDTPTPASPPPPCTGSAQALESTWDDSRAEEVSAALMGTDMPWSEHVRDEVVLQLRHYATAWVGEHEAACRATRIEGTDSEEVLELRMGCLDRRRRSLSALVDVLTRADVEVAAQAVQATQALPPLASCRDVAALRAPVPLPDSAHERAEAEAIFDELARVEALRQAKHTDDAAALAERAVTRASELGHRPTEADARLAWGWVLTDRGEHEAAETQLRDALHAAEAGRHDQAVVLAWNRLAWVVGYKRARFDEGRQLARHAEAWGDRATVPAHQTLSRLRTLGWIEYEAGNFEAALGHFEAGIAEAERLPDDDPHRSHELGLTLNGLGATAVHAADLPRAAEAFDRSTALMEANLGPEHPDTAQVRNNLTSLLRAQGQPERAHALLTRNLEVFETTYGPEHSLVGQTLANLAVVELDLGRHADAHAHADRCITVLRAANGPEHPMVSKGHTLRGDALVQLGRVAEALEDFELALEQETRVLGPEHPSVGIIESNIGGALYDLKRFEEAAAHQQRALQILEETLGTEHPNLAIPLTSLGLTRRRQDQPDAALELFRRAAALGGPADRPVAQTRVGEVLIGQGRHAEGIAALEEALVQFAKIEQDPGFSGDAHFSLGRALWAQGEQQRARIEVAAARDDYRAGGDTEPLAETEQWLREHAASAPATPIADDGGAPR